jgi:hypothetical protein
MYSAHLELSRQPKTADLAIRSLATLIHTLPKAERELWDTANVRDFNVGVQAAMRPHSYEIPLAYETIKIASALKARIVFTIYAAEAPKSKKGPAKKALQRTRATGRAAELILLGFTDILVLLRFGYELSHTTG